MKRDFLDRTEQKDIEALVDIGVITKVMIRRYLICQYIWDQVMSGSTTENAVREMMGRYGMSRRGIKQIYYKYRNFRT